MKTTTTYFKPVYLLLVLALFISGCNKNKINHESFKFAFLTDIHLNSGDNGCFEGLNMAIESARENSAEFIITGGDNADIDGYKSDTGSAKELFEKYSDIISTSPLKIYPTMGNHDRFWGIISDEKPYGEALFEELISPSYYSFDYKGWEFIILNSVQNSDGVYIIDSIQVDWIKTELASIDKNSPIIISLHVPMMSVYSPSGPGRFGQDMFYNFAEVNRLFDEYNLKLVLQGHQHLYEEIKTRGVQYITGGAVSASWWGGKYYDTEEGYLLVSINGDQFTWEYIDYGWEVNR